MKRIVLYTLVGVLLLAIIAGVFGIVGFLNFMKPGIHSLAGYTKLDFQETVYFVNADTKEVDGSSTKTVYLKQPFKNAPDYATASVNYDIEELKAGSEIVYQ